MVGTATTGLQPFCCRLNVIWLLQDRKKQDSTINALKSHLQHAKTQVEALEARREEEMQSVAKDKEVQVEGLAAQVGKQQKSRRHLSGGQRT